MTDSSDIEEQSPFRVGDWIVDPDSGRLLKEGTEVKLEPKVMHVLVTLAQHPGKVISREALEAKVWAGTIVGYDAVSGSIIKLRKALGDDSRNPQYIETVSKKGYRLIAPVTQNTGEVPTSATFQPASTGQPAQTKSRQRKLIVAGISLVVVFGLLFLAIRPDMPDQPTELLAKTPSIVVLPFKNLSNDPQQEYFSDGMTDDLITDLSKVGSMRVIARQSAYHYKKKQFTLDDVARELNVQYIVEGSVQRSGETLRINVQVSNVEKGHQIWAERFDSNIDNIFDIQDEITRRVIDAMYITLSKQESKRMSYRITSNFEAYDSFLQGQLYSRQRNKEGFDLSMDAYKRAIKLDPEYARAYGAMAVELTFGYRHQWSELTLLEARERTLILAAKAVKLDQFSPQVYWSLGFVHIHRKEFEEAEAAAKQTVSLSPNFADGYGLLAFVANWRGKAEDAARYIEKATALNPYHTYDYPWNLGMAQYTLGIYSDAAENFEGALERNESALYPRLFLAASYVRLGRIADAKWEIEQVSIERPGTTVSHLANTMPFEHQHLMDKLMGDLRKAGLPE